MRRLRLIALGALLSLPASVLSASAPVPRKSPELTVHDPEGKLVQLSSFRGEVVVVEFWLSSCQHCWRLAQTITKLHQELAPRGLQAIGVAFDSNMSEQAAADLAKNARVSYPVGFTTADQVDSYLGREPNERFRIPQIVVIDRAGMIRAQSRPIGETNLEDETYLRALLDTLLKESAPVAAKPAAPPPR